jgi:hypothetical protein
MTLRRHAAILVGALLVVVTPMLVGEAPPLPTFTDIAKQAGIDFVHSFGDNELSSIVESTGAGCGLFDYDNDGDLDAYLLCGCYLKGLSDPRSRHLAGKLKSRLYRNNGDGTFTDVTDEADVGHEGFAMACVAADYDNDGDLDLLVTNYGSNLFYRNNGDGTFTDITAQAGLDSDLWGIGSTFFDYNNDGYVDLYVGHYLEYDPNYRFFYAPDHFPGPLSYKGQPDTLYRNNGDGTFTDVTKAAGVYNPEGRAMGVTSADYDNDGDMDIVVANDAMVNFMYRNNGDGTFTDVALEMGTAFGQSGEATSAMGPAVGDLDRDGFFDIMIPDMQYGCLYHNHQGEYFEEKAAPSGIASVLGQYVSWGGDLFDYDNDGWLDVFITNGDAHKMEPQEDCLFRNEGGLRFRDVSVRSGEYFKRKYVGRGAAFGDVDNDGDIDILILNLNGPAVLLRNDGGNRSHWLLVKTVGTKSNRDGIGTRLCATVGDLKQIGEVRSGSGYLAMNDLRVHFGLGSHEQVERLDVRWPSGITQVLENVKADQILTLVEPER